MIFRIEKTKDYTVMSNYHLREKNMSLKAKGLLSWMLSNDDEWDYSISGIVANCKENETAIKSALDELQQFGYLTIKKLMPESYIDDNGNKIVIRKLIEYEYIVYEKPNTQEYVNQDIENQSLENPVQRNTNIRNTNIRNRDIISKDIISHNTDTVTSQSTVNDTVNDTSDTLDDTFSKPDKKINNIGSGLHKSNKESLWDKCARMINEFTDNSNLSDLLFTSLKMMLENSRESNTPFYTNSFKGKLNNLRKLSDDVNMQMDIVQQTLDNGWNNFYAIKTNKSRQNNVAMDIEHLYSGINQRAEKGGKIIEKF